MAALHLVKFFGYGCHLDTPLRPYLDRGVMFCNQKRPDCFIFSGGFTQRKTAPGISEARLMNEYVISRLDYSPALIYLDEDSYTTPDSAQNMAKIIKTDNLVDEKTILTVFCEATRALKVDLLIRHFLGRRANIETDSWELMSPQKQIIATLYDWAAINCSPLARYWHNKRLRRAEQI